MKKIAQGAGEQELSVEERNLLSVAYKNLVGARRASWRILQSVEQVRAISGLRRTALRRDGPPSPCHIHCAPSIDAAQSELAKGNEKRVKLIQSYRTVVEKELDDICGEILTLLDKHLIPSASTVEASVFYLKMKADYHRYLAEFKVRDATDDDAVRDARQHAAARHRHHARARRRTTSQVDDDRKNASDKTLEAYKAAQDKATAELPSTNPIRLGLALNFSVFYYEVLNQPEQACSLAKQVRRRWLDQVFIVCGVGSAVATTGRSRRRRRGSRLVGTELNAEAFCFLPAACRCLLHAGV